MLTWENTGFYCPCYGHVKSFAHMFCCFSLALSSLIYFFHVIFLVSFSLFTFHIFLVYFSLYLGTITAKKVEIF